MAFIRTNDGFTCVINNKSYTISKTHPKYPNLLKLYRDKDYQEFDRVYSLSNKEVEVKYGGIYLNGVRLVDVLGRRVTEMILEGFDVTPMKKLLENILKNPSQESVKDLYVFLEHENLPITEDGCFLAYKVVGGDFFSKTSGNLKLTSGCSDLAGRIRNSIGEHISCDRREVVDDRNTACAAGLHVGNLKYAGPGGQFYTPGDKVLIVKVNPKDVVSVPKDHDCGKMRVCAYEVLSEYRDLPKSVDAPTNEDNYIDIDLLVVGDEIEFDYFDSRGIQSHRKCYIESFVGDKVCCEDENGQYRTFFLNKMSKVKMV